MIAKRTTKEHAVLDLLSELGVKRILDIGCGKGKFARSAAQHGFEVVGIDQNLPSKLDGSKEINLQLNRTMLQEYAGSDPFDAAVIMFVLHSLSEQEGRDLVNLALKRHIKPGGMLIIMDYSYPKASIKNCFGWLRIEIDELLTIAQDQTFTHYRNFRRFVAYPYVTSLNHQASITMHQKARTVHWLAFPSNG